MGRSARICSIDNELEHFFQQDALRTLFRERARIPVDPALERGRALLLSGLNRRVGRSLVLRGTVDSVALRALYATRAGLVVRAEATGDAAVAIRAPEPGEPAERVAGARAELAGAAIR